MSFHMNSIADGVSTGSDKSEDHDVDNKQDDQNRHQHNHHQHTKTSPDGDKKWREAARFVAELRPEEIRWFYKKTTQDKTWLPLNGRDSLVIEEAYRLREQSKLVSGQQSKSNSRDDLSSSPQKSSPMESTTPDGEFSVPGRPPVVAFDGLYQFVIEDRKIDNAASDSAAAATTPDSPSKPIAEKTQQEKSKSSKPKYRLKPIYWEAFSVSGGSLFLTRGTWFYEAAGVDWQPLDADSAEFVQKVESKHLNVFANQRIPEKPVYFEKGPKPVLCEVCDAEEEKSMGSGARARWHSVVDVLLINNSRSSRLWRYLKLTGEGTKLKRGYHTLAKYEDGPLPITHLCFVIHGIGQKRQRNKIVTNATSIREIADQLIKTNYPNLGGRPMFLPVDWRNELQLDEELIASITPTYLEQIRGFFNETLMDLLYYASPRFGPVVINGMTKVLNRLYRLYLSNDPDFEARGGRVSLIAHSLGSVITYDILTGGWYGKPEVQKGVDERVSGTEAEANHLVFPVDNLFCFGSPLGVFLAARSGRGLEIIQPKHVETRFRLHNIYHPADPVAYRVEPLVSAIYGTVRPLRIHRYDTIEHSLYTEMLPEILQDRTTSGGGPSPTPKFDLGGGANSGNERSDTEDNVSGFESDEGPNPALQRVREKERPASSPSPPPKRSWSAAVFSRLGMGNKENTPPPSAQQSGAAGPAPGAKTATTPEASDADKPSIGDVVTSVAQAVTVQAAAQVVNAAEQAAEAKEGLPPDEPKEAEKPKVEKKEFEVPPDQVLPYRIDYTLRLGRMDYAYWAAIVSHISYWANHDAVMYIISAMYGPPKHD